MVANIRHLCPVVPYPTNRGAKDWRLATFSFGNQVPPRKTVPSFEYGSSNVSAPGARKSNQGHVNISY